MRRLALVVAVVLVASACRQGEDTAPFAGWATDYADAWEALPDAPLAPQEQQQVWWTGDEIVVRSGGRSAAFDPEVGSWRRLRNVPRAAFAATAGGQLFAAQDGELLRYDPAEDRSWREEAPDIPDHTLEASDDGHLLALRRCTCPQDPPAEWELDVTTGDWRRLPDHSSSRQIVRAGERLYGFSYGLPEASSVETLADGADEWEVVAEVPAIGIGEVASVGDLIVGTSQLLPPDSPSPPTDIWVFDTRSDETVDVPEPGGDLGRPFVRAVGDGVAYFDHDVLDVDDLTWSEVTDVPDIAPGAALVWIGDRWFAFGGRVDGEPTNAAFMWTPAS